MLTVGLVGGCSGDHRRAARVTTTSASTVATSASTVATSTRPPMVSSTSGQVASTTTSTVPLPAAHQFPALLVAVDGSGVHAIAPGSDRLVVEVAHPEVAYRLADGSIVVQTGDTITTQALHRALSRWYPD